MIKELELWSLLVYGSDYEDVPFEHRFRPRYTHLLERFKSALNVFNEKKEPYKNKDMPDL